MSDLNAIFEKIDNVISRSQEIPGPRPELDGAWDVRDGYAPQYRLNEETITLKEFLELAEAVRALTLHLQEKEA